MSISEIPAVQQGAELYRKVYNKEISEECFYHKHFDNPNALSESFIIELQNDTPVAMRWLMKLNFCYDGNIVSGVQSSDDAVLDEARGLLFLKMRKKTLNILQQNSIDFEYGCFYPGTAMEIAEKFGEKNIVNLYMARLFLNERTHRWKRFDISIPAFVRKVLIDKRTKRFADLSQKDLTIDISEKCQFGDEDYKKLNSASCFQIERNQSYYNWKTSGIDNLSIITARKDNELYGFLIVKKESDYGIVVDWDLFGENKIETLASMLLPICRDYQYLDVPSLNIESGEMKLFTALGSKDMSSLWAPICICANVINDGLSSIICDSKKWKHRLIDADYFLNGE